jgi:hypothetical protein
MDTSDRLTDNSANSNMGNMISHVVDIMKAAFPYLDSDSQQSVDILIKTDELLQTYHDVSNNKSVTTFSIRKQSIDFEALLRGVRDVCYPQERVIVDMILNFFQAKKLYDTYVTVTQAMSSQPDMSENLGSMFGMNSNVNMSEMLESMLTPEQKSTFDNMTMMFNMMQS